MAKYQVLLYTTASFYVVEEAESESEALQQAFKRVQDVPKEDLEVDTDDWKVDFVEEENN